MKEKKKRGIESRKEEQRRRNNQSKLTEESCKSKSQKRYRKSCALDDFMIAGLGMSSGGQVKMAKDKSMPCSLPMPI